MPDRELVSLAQHGDKQAYHQLVERYQRRAFALALEVTNSQQDAEDVVQEAFVKAYLSLRTFKGNSAFYTWLYRIVYNMAIDVKRRAQRRGGESLEYDEVRVNSRTASELSTMMSERFSSPHAALQRKEHALRIQETISQLSEEHRAVVVLRELDGCSYAEIADILGINKGTVMSRLFYARKRLQEELVDLRMGAEPGVDKDPVINEE